MEQDIRELLRNAPEAELKLPEGHEARFEIKLDMHGQKESRRNYFFFLKIAAAVVVFLGLGYTVYNYLDTPTIDGTELAEEGQQQDSEETPLSLGDLSPDLKKVEDFYTAGIQVQLASIQENPENEELIEGYKKRLQELDAEYERLTLQLNKVGPTEATINALVDNLKLRLELLFKLKNKLKELKNQENDAFEIV